MKVIQKYKNRLKSASVKVGYRRPRFLRATVYKAELCVMCHFTAHVESWGQLELVEKRQLS